MKTLNKGNSLKTQGFFGKALGTQKHFRFLTSKFNGVAVS